MPNIMNVLMSDVRSHCCVFSTHVYSNGHTWLPFTVQLLCSLLVHSRFNLPSEKLQQPKSRQKSRVTKGHHGKWHAANEGNYPRSSCFQLFGLLSLTHIFFCTVTKSMPVGPTCSFVSFFVCFFDSSLDWFFCPFLCLFLCQFRGLFLSVSLYVSLSFLGLPLGPGLFICSVCFVVCLFICLSVGFFVCLVVCFLFASLL